MNTTQMLQNENIKQKQKINMIQFIAGYFVYLYKVAVRPN